MKTNIIKIDQDRIHVEVDSYVDKYGRSPNYIVMNEDTAQSLSVFNKETINFGRTFNETKAEEVGFIHTFRGVPIAICPILKFGEIDVI